MKGTKAKGSSLQKDPKTINRIKTPQVIVKSNVVVAVLLSVTRKFEA